MNSWSWIPMTGAEDEQVWNVICRQFHFSPSTTEFPSFQVPHPFVTYSTRDVKWKEIETVLSHILITLTDEGERIMALDWNHQGYWVDPRQPFERDEEGTWIIPALPDGDYNFFIARDFQWGYLGHPWEQSVTLFGENLMTAFEESGVFPDVIRPRERQMTFQPNESVSVYRQLLPRDDWNELVRIQLNQYSFPFEIKLLERPRNTKQQHDYEEWGVASHFIATETMQMERFLEGLTIPPMDMLSEESNTVLRIRKQGQDIVLVSNQEVTMHGVIYEELKDLGTEYENFFDAILPHATFPLEVVFCGRGTLDDEDSIHAMTLNDTNWQAVFEDRLLHLLNRKEITSGFLSTNYSKPTQRTLENFMTEFMLIIPYNFILTRDATGRFGMFDHFCTNEKIAHFGNIVDIQHA
jgi:hypothetical protein